MNCQYCDGEIDQYYREELNKELIAMQACFTCHFWLKAHDADKNLPWYGGLVFGGKHWRTRNIGVNKNDPRYPNWMRGSGGRAYKLTNLATGESVETNDLWHQGRIPDHFRHLFPDNATIEPLDPPRIFHTNAFSAIAEGEAQS